MGMLNDIISSLSSKTIRTKLTLKERADLLIEIVNDLEWESFAVEDKNGNWLYDDDIKAMEYLSANDDLLNKNKLKKVVK